MLHATYVSHFITCVVNVIHFWVLTFHRVYTFARKSQTSYIIARFRDRSLIATFCPLRRKPVDTVDWQVAKKIGSLSFYTKMSRRWLISSLKLKGLYRWDFLIINTELKRKDGNFMYSRSLEDCNAEFFVS